MSERPPSALLLFFLSLIIKTVGRLPIKLRSLLGRFLGYCFSFIPTRDRRVAELQMDWLLPDQGGRRHVPAVYASVGQTLLESLNLAPLLDDVDRYLCCPDMALYHELIGRKRGIVTLTAHTGNWDLLAAYMIKLGTPLATVGRQARSPSLQQLLSDIRQSYGVKTIWRAGHSALREIKEELEQNHVVAALIDQDTRVKSVHVPFFGVPAKTPVALLEIGKRFGAIPVACFIFRSARDRYTVRIFELPAERPAEEILAEYHRLLESLIRQHPEQWVWFHKRWRTRPDGETLSSRAYIAALEEKLAARERQHA